MLKDAEERMEQGNFFARYRPRDLGSAPKYVVLREAIIAAIQDGYWKAGDRLPTELELTSLTPYSLGTVQRAVQGLVADGFVTRRQGSGSFVATAQKRIGGPWIFRFLTRDGKSFLPMFTKVVSRQEIAGSGPSLRWLTGGEANSSVLRIERLVIANDAFTVYNRYYLDPARFPVIAAMSQRELDGANFAGVIEKTYKLPITHIARTMEWAEFPEVACRFIGLPAGSSGLFVEIAASAGRRRPVFYQQLFIPPGATRLFISETFDEWIASMPEDPDRRLAGSRAGGGNEGPSALPGDRDGAAGIAGGQ